MFMCVMTKSIKNRVNTCFPEFELLIATDSPCQEPPRFVERFSLFVQSRPPPIMPVLGDRLSTDRPYTVRRYILEVLRVSDG